MAGLTVNSSRCEPQPPSCWGHDSNWRSGLAHDRSGDGGVPHRCHTAISAPIRGASCKDIRRPARAVPPCGLWGEPCAGAVRHPPASPEPLWSNPVANSPLADSRWADAGGHVPPSGAPQPRDHLTAGDRSWHTACGATGCASALPNSALLWKVEYSRDFRSWPLPRVFLGDDALRGLADGRRLRGNALPLCDRRGAEW